MGVEKVERSEAICGQEDWNFDDAPVCRIPRARLILGLTVIDSPRTDYALVQDKAFKKWVQAYAADEALFFKE